MFDTIGNVDFTFYAILGVSLFFLILITVVMIYFVFRYSKKRNPVSTDIRGNIALEITWTVIPTLIAMWMFWLGWESYMGLRKVPENAIRYHVTGRMFEWEVEYPNEKIASQIVVPQGKPVHLTITSEDVIHSFYVPAFRIKVDAVPKMNTYAWFNAEKLGDYDLFCAEYCGAGHADMTSIIKIVTPEQYQNFIKSEAEDWEEYQEILEEQQEEES